MGKIQDTIDQAIFDLEDAGRGSAKIARRLIEAGLRGLLDGGYIDEDSRIALVNGDGGYRISTIVPVKTGDDESFESSLNRLIRAHPDDPTVDSALVTRGLDGFLRGSGLDTSQVLLKRNNANGFEVECAVEGYQIVPVSADFPAVQPLSEVPAPGEPPEAVVNAVGAIRYQIDRLKHSGIMHLTGEGETTLAVIDRLLRDVMLVTDADIPAYIRTKAMGARRLDQTDTARAFDALAEEIESNIHVRPIDVRAALGAFYLDVYNRNVKAGWWSDLATGERKKRNVGELFMLMVTELQEAYKAYILNDPDDKLPEYPGLGVELGDLQIRLADFIGALMSGQVVIDSNASNPGDKIFRSVVDLALKYEAIRKTPLADGDPETGEFLEPQDVPTMIFAKLDYNANRADHKIENRKKAGGKRT